MKKHNLNLPILLLSATCMIVLLVTVVHATTVTNYTVSSGHLQNNNVNDIFIYNRIGEQSSNALGFDANWWRGVAKTSGDPTVNPSSNITISGTQSNKVHRLRVLIESGGATGTATFRTSLDGGSIWSTTTYTTQSTAQNLEYDGTDTGLDITFASGAGWTANDVFTIASWWGEGASATRSSTQNFPQKVAIIVTDGGVEIIDLSDNSVWMRFVPSNTPTAADQNIVAGPVHSVTALNGKIYLGAEGGYMGGVAVIDLQADKVWFYDAGDGWDWTSNIARRNDGSEADAGWVQAAPAYPSLTSNTVYDLDVAVVGDHTYLAIGTANRFNLLKDHTSLYYNTYSRCEGQVPAVALVGNDLYWSGERVSDHVRALCARYDFTTISASGSWPPMHIYDTPYLISTAINALAGRDGTSPVQAGSNIIYVGTDAGLSIIHEKQGDELNGEFKHYGYTGSSNNDLDYKVMAGNTDQVSDVDFAEGYTGVYVATNDGAEGGAVSVLRPYMEAGDNPFLFEYYRTDTTPSILSNDVSALAHGSDLLVGTDDSGANRMGGAPTAVELTHLAAHSSGVSIPPVALALALVMLAGLVAARTRAASRPGRHQ